LIEDKLTPATRSPFRLNTLGVVVQIDRQSDRTTDAAKRFTPATVIGRE